MLDLIAIHEAFNSQDFARIAVESKHLAAKAGGVELGVPELDPLNLNNHSQVISDREAAKARLMDVASSFIRTAKVFNDATPGSNLAIATANALRTSYTSIWKQAKNIERYEKWLQRDPALDHGSGISGGQEPGAIAPKWAQDMEKRIDSHLTQIGMKVREIAKHVLEP